MNDQLESRMTHRLGFMIPMLLFVLIFVLACSVLASLFVRSKDISLRAGQKNDAVQICRNQAERFRTGEELEDMRLYFSADGRQSEPSTADYYVEICVSEESRPVGRMLYGSFTAYNPAGEAVYTLNAARYVPDGR